jgi:uncharacterized protein YqkB
MKFTTSRPITWTSTFVALAALTACGGGGSGDPSNYTAITPIASPNATATGLVSSPTKDIDFTTGTGALNQVGAFILDLRGSLSIAPLAKGLAGMAATDDDGTGPYGGSYLACQNPATLTIAGSSYTFSSCDVNGYLFDGTATLSTIPASNQYKLDFEGGAGIQVTLPGGSSPVSVRGFALCTVQASGAAPKCLVEIVDPYTASNPETFRFGWNATFDNATINGTHGCGCDGVGAAGTWLVTVNNLTETGGTALIQARNGQALVRRNSAIEWDAELTPTGGQTQIIEGLTFN